MNLIYSLMQKALSFLLFYAFMASFYVSFIKNKQFDFLTLFFVLTLFVFSALSVYRSFRKSLFKKSNRAQNGKKIIEYRKLFLVLTICFISLFIGFFNVSTQYSRGVADPEMNQFGSSFSKNMVEASKRQQQPPLDYYFSAFSHSLFGKSKFAVRFHALYFYLALSFILPLGIYFFCSSYLIAILGALLFANNHVIRLHSVDARPLCLALLTGFLFLFFFLSYCRDNSGPNQASKETALFPIFSSQYLFAVSIGLQPVIFIVSLFFSSFWLLLFKYKQTFQKLFIANIITGILTAPFYVNMFLFGRDAYKFKDVSIDTIKLYFINFDIPHFLDKYFLSFYREMSFFFLIMPIGLLAVVFIKKRLSKLLRIISSALIIFPILYDPIFQIGIIWNGLHNWYIIVFSLFLIVFLALALKEMEALIPKRWKIYFWLPLLICFAVNMLSQIKAIKNTTQFHFPYRDNSIEKVYQFLNANGSQKDIAIQFSLKPIVFYREADIKQREILFYNKEKPLINSFYLAYTKTKPYFYESDGDLIYYIEKWPIQAIDKKRKIFLMSKKENDYDEAYNILSRFMESATVGEYAIFTLAFSNQKEYIKFLSKINKNTPDKYKGALLESLIYYAYKNNNRKEFFRLLKEYKGIEKSLDEYIPHFNYPSRFELRRRVKYFENLEWNKPFH